MAKNVGLKMDLLQYNATVPYVIQHGFSLCRKRVRSKLLRNSDCDVSYTYLTFEVGSDRAVAIFFFFKTKTGGEVFKGWFFLLWTSQNRRLSSFNGFQNEWKTRLFPQN